MSIRLCWTCKQPATHALTRDGSIPLDACDNCTRIDRAEAESRGWTITPIQPVTLTKDAVTQYDIATNPQGATIYNTMDAREAEANIRCAVELGDTIQDYNTTDRTGRPLRVVLHICTSTDREDLGGVYEFTR